MEFPFLSHHGGTRGVTGSCHQLHLDHATSLLIDCGLEQGADASPGAGAAPLAFGVSGVQVLILTHVHLDHVGRIPALLAAGYRGPILCSEPSAKLLPLVLEDAYRLSVSREPTHVARYLDILAELIVPVPFGHWHDVVLRPGLECRIRLQRAGHLLGSAYVECDVRVGEGERDSRWVFSGDLGSGRNPLLRAVQPPERADVLVLESTYGDRLHAERSERRQKLAAAIDHAMADNGTVLIPAFSLGRTQELLYELEDILHQKALLGGSAGARGAEPFDWLQLPIIVDSPLAQRVTSVYRDLHDYWNAEVRARLAQGRDPLDFSQLVCVDSHGRHQQVVNYLKSTARPAIVIAGNGMCSGGRIVNYLKAMLGDSRHEVIFVGYQAKGTPGAAIQASEGAPGFVQIDLDGKLYEVRLKVMTVAGFSAHADQAELVRFALEGRAAAGRVLLVHGEPKAKRALALALEHSASARGIPLQVQVP
ncbi:TPA: MBL fold metallo-hydrolase [Pseudomonas putida]|nr:MBL fold metallo-hydrolase [Pseudomonas putida]